MTAPLPLDPGGAVAAHHGAARTRDVFRRLGLAAARCDLGDDGLYLAEEIARADFAAGEADRAALGCLALAAQIAARSGATRLPLPAPGRPGRAGPIDRSGPLARLVGDIARTADPPLDAADLLRRIARLTAQPALGGVIGTPPHVRPLLVDDGCLYTHKHHRLECEVAGRLAARLAAPPAAAAAAVAAAVADVRARAADLALSDEQVAAVAAAAGAPLAVVSGGPGTGKTQVAAAVARALARLGAARIALAAPTGKAANRLGASVARQLDAIADPDAHDRALAAAPPPGQTLHRLLGFRPGGGFRHDAHNPLPFDAVLVDEASMIDLALADRLLDALAPGARLVLFGDARQLPSVDAGQVLADLVAVARGRGDGDGGARAPWCAVLEHSFRTAGDADGRAVLDCARAIDAGTGRLLASRLVTRRDRAGDLAWRGVEHLDARLPPRRAALLDAWFDEHARPPDRARTRAFRRAGGRWDPDDAGALADLLAHHDRRRILCATRGQAAGADAVNDHLHRRLLALGTTAGEPDFLPGEPVIMTANDYERGFFNGDPGVVVRVVEDGGAQRYRVVLRRGDELVPVPIDAVRGSLEQAWALTVHKSQGSEYDLVMVLLPDEVLPIATRELLYTALTRARRAAVLVAREGVLEEAIDRSAPRYSGLPDRIAREVP